MAVADILKSLRTDKQLSQEQLAEQLGVSKGAISNYERGSRVPSLDIVMMWAMSQDWRRELAMRVLEEHNYIEVRKLCQKPN